jgi:hypothetical protein
LRGPRSGSATAQHLQHIAACDGRAQKAVLLDLARAGIDFDANGLFDRLRVQVGVETDRAGLYNWSGRLTDPAGVEIGFASGSAVLPVGGSTLTLIYEGERFPAM